MQSNRSGSGASSPRSLKLATWNVESIRAHHDQVVAWIDANHPDVVCMQETKAGARKFPIRSFVDRGFDLVLHGGDDGRGGVAMASRLPMTDICEGIPGAVAPLDEPRSISATIDGLRIHTVYAPNGRKVATPAHEIKLAWFALLDAWLRIDRDGHGSAECDQILAGDLNIAPEDIDVWDANRYRKRNLTSPRERSAFLQLLAAGGLVDVVRDRFGDDAVFTWWNRRSDFYATDRGWRLDHILATPGVASRIESVEVDRAERGRPGSTDHAPVVVTLEGAEAR